MLKHNNYVSAQEAAVDVAFAVIDAADVHVQRELLVGHGASTNARPSYPPPPPLRVLQNAHPQAPGLQPPACCCSRAPCRCRPPR